jgi:NDP-sugar pyrophosphorylase family protein
VRAFVLAGGLGTRLRDRFGDLPKPLVPVGGKPFLSRQLEWLAAHELREVVLCLGYGADRVEQALGNGAAAGVRLFYSREDEPLGTGGALKLAETFVEGPSLVINGDTLPELAPASLERVRSARGSTGAVALFQLDDVSASGRVECDEEGRITAFSEKDPERRGPGWVNGGCYSFDVSLWSWLPEGPSSLERDVLPRVAAAGKLVGQRIDGAFFDIGTPAGWERAERRFAA